MKKRFLAGLLSAAVTAALLTSCSGDGAGNQGTDSYMQYITKEDLKADMEAGGSYIMLDVRISEDYDEQHITKSYSADVDPSVNHFQNDTATTNIKNALSKATGSDAGNIDSKIVIIGYTGEQYAETATNLMINMGIPEENIYTLEGGINGWAEAGDEYALLLE